MLIIAKKKPKLTQRLKKSIKILSSSTSKRIKSPPKKKSRGKQIPRDQLQIANWAVQRKDPRTGKKRWYMKYKHKKTGKIVYRVQQDQRKAQPLTQRQLIKQQHGIPTMYQTFPENIAKSSKELGKSNREYSIAIDFERRHKQPQRVVAMQGGKVSTVHLKDFELFGHTHPGQYTPRISTGDLRNMKLGEPNFIVAGKTGTMHLYNIQDPKKFNKWKEKNESKAANTVPITNEDLEYANRRLKRFKNNPKARNVNSLNYSDTKLGRDMFESQTGIKITPYKKNMLLELKDDPTYDKQVPTIPKEYGYMYSKPNPSKSKSKKKRKKRKKKKG